MEGFTEIQKKAYMSTSNQIMNATEEELDEMNKEDNPDFVGETLKEKQDFRLELEYSYISQGSDMDCRIYLD